MFPLVFQWTVNWDYTFSVLLNYQIINAFNLSQGITTKNYKMTFKNGL